MASFCEIVDVYGRDWKINPDQVSVLRTYYGIDPSEKENLAQELLKELKATRQNWESELENGAYEQKVEEASLVLPTRTLTDIYVAGLDRPITVLGLAPFENIESGVKVQKKKDLRK